MRTLNLGILAHVDAGKTTLTERILFTAGATDRVGSVDEGTTQTDTLALERERGITIRSAVASFAVGDLAVNVLDTPGHPDFIAEVERVLAVLDGAVLVVSAVEGVQPQTPLLWRALQRLRVPTLIFVNKIDRSGADAGRTLAAIDQRLTPAIASMGRVDDVGTREARFAPWPRDDARFRTALAEGLSENDDSLLAAYVDDEIAVPGRRVWRALLNQVRRAEFHPVFYGAAVTGAGVEALIDGIVQLLPPATRNRDAPLTGQAFKVERTTTGERVAYVRVFAGTARVRDRIRYGTGGQDRVTGLRVFAPGGAVQRRAAVAGDIAKMSGLVGIRVGDPIGDRLADAIAFRFAPPTLAALVVPRQPGDRGRLGAALAELAEQDPLINVRHDDASGELSVSLYGEVQKEVIGATLARDYGIEVDFHDSTTIHVERPIGIGEALAVLRAATHSNVTGKSSPHSDNPFLATLGMRVEPAPIGSGVDVRPDVDVRFVPLYLYKTVDAFTDAMTGYVREALGAGLFGWQVIDALVTITDCGYRAPGTTAGDFHRLTSLVLTQALEHAGSQVCEPMAALELELPTDALSRTLSLLARLGAGVETTVTEGQRSTIRALLSAKRLDELRRAVPEITGGEGVLESRFGGYRPVSNAPSAAPHS